MAETLVSRVSGSHIETVPIAPKPGQYSICTGCGSLSMFAQRPNAVRPDEVVWYRRELTREEFHRALTIPGFAEQIVAVRFAMARAKIAARTADRLNRDHA